MKREVEVYLLFEILFFRAGLDLFVEEAANAFEVLVVLMHL